MNEAQKFLYVREHHCNHLYYSEIASLHGSLPFDFSRNSLCLRWILDICLAHLYKFGA